MNVLSIQSAVAYGHVGNNAAAFPLQRLGHEVWPVNTVNYSNHPRYGSYKGGIFNPQDIRETLDEIELRGGFNRCDAVLTGFIGAAETGEAALEAVQKIKAANPSALYVLDPVIGDVQEGIYVGQGIPEFFRDQALRQADIVIPNVFELAYLTGQTIEDVDSAAEAASSLIRQGPGIVVVTGLQHENEISVLLVTGGQAWQATTPLIDVDTWGAGDAFSALFLGAYFNLRDARAAVARAVSSIYGIFSVTKDQNEDSLALVAGQKEIVNPTERFAALPIWAE